MIFITKINMSAPCSMPLCHNIATHSIHDIPGREQTGVIICEECLKGIVDAYGAPEAPPEIPEPLEVELVGPEPEPVEVVEKAPEPKPVAKKKPAAKKKPVTKK